MIIRILGEGQFEVDASYLDALNKLDDTVEQACESGDDQTFSAALNSLLDAVRTSGTALPDEELVDSDLILPPSDATAHEVKALLGDEGLIPDAV
jgi:hypothetical protein